jgi:probable HAF family extracellular repeat protein
MRAPFFAVAAVAATLLSPLSTAQIPCGYEVTAVIQGPYCDSFGYPITIPQDIGENGEVVGYYNVCTVGPAIPFVWTENGGFVSLDLPAGFSTGTIRGIDDQTGWLVGSTDGPGTDGPYATVWQNGQPMVLGTLPGGNYSSAFASANGRIVGRWGNDSTGDPGLQAFLWEDGVMTDLAADLGTPVAEARDVNEVGQVVGWMGTGSLSDARAFIWEAGQVTDLGPVPGGFTSEAWAANSSSEVVGSGQWVDPQTGDEFLRAFVWHDGEMVNIGTVQGFLQSGARDINDAGLVIGAAVGPSLLVASIWHKGVMIDLNTLIPEEPGVGARIARAINNAGQIVCEGNNEENDVVAILLTPFEQPLGDLSCDGSVSEDDFWLLLEAWGACPAAGGCPGDLDGDGAVGIVDFLMLLANWG